MSTKDLLDGLRQDTLFANLHYVRLRQALEALVASSDLYLDEQQRYHHVA